MTILCNELTLEQINSALLRLQRSMQNNTNNFQNDVEKAVANVTINSKNTVQRYDDSYLMSIVTDIRDKYKDLVKTDQDMLRSIINLETILANVSLNYDEVGNVITFNLGDYSTSFTLKDTTYTFSYDTETGHFTIVDNVTGETVFEETFNDTTYTFSFNNGILTIHNNLLNTDQTFNFDERYYTEAEIQSLILDKIPPEASASNQLADKSFVNSSIATATATFRGTVTTTQALAALTGDLNDYAYLQNIDPTTGQTLSYDRYKWVEDGGDYGHWKYEYTLNNSSFTSDQWAAINSGITCQIVQDLLDGCYSGNGSALCKSAGNEWRNLLSTNCNCTGSVDADYVYYNTNIQTNQYTGALLANCYCVKDHGLATFATQNLTATCIGLTAGCTYPLTCILESIMACCGYNAGTYTFAYANAANLFVQETGGYAYLMSFTKEDSANPVNGCWSMTRWTVKATNGTIYTARAYSTSSPGIASWTVSRTGNVTGGSFNGIAGTVSNGSLSFSNINFDNICDSADKVVAANNITRRHIITNQISSVGYRTRWGLGLERGTAGWGTGLLSLGVKDDGTCFADYKFTHAGSISLTCCGTAKCITLSGCATKNVFTCCLSSTNATQRYVQIKTKANRGSSSVSFDFDFFSMNGTINLDHATPEYTGTRYGVLQVARCDYTCTCCDCFWISYAGYRTLTLKSVYDFEVLCNTTTAPEGVTFSNLSYRLGTVCKVAAELNTSYNLLMSSDSDNTRIITLGSASGLTFNPTTNILSLGPATGCTSSVTGTSGTTFGRGYQKLYGNTPYIDFHVNNYCGDYSHRIIADGGALCFIVNNGKGCTASTQYSTFIMRSAGYAYIPGCIIHNGEWVERWRWDKPDNSGWPVYRLLYDITSWYNGTTGVAYKGIVGIITQVRTGGYTHDGVSTITASVSWGRNGQADTCVINSIRTLTWACLGYNPGAVSPYILKCGSCYYLAIRATGSGRPIFFTGHMTTPNDLLTTTINTTDVNGTLPTGWSIVSSPSNCFAATRAFAQDRCLTNNDATCHVALWGGNTAAVSVCEYVAGDRPLTYNPGTGILGVNKGLSVGNSSCVGCPFIFINCDDGQRMISMTKATNSDIGLMLSHAADWTGTTYCNLGIEIGSGNVNRGFYHCKAGTFEWLQFWDATCERHACPQCFACPIYGCSSATFASYKTRALYISCSFPANSTSYILLGCYSPSNVANASNELNLGFTAGGADLVEKGSIKLLLTTADGSYFCNNNIEVKMSNYLIGSNRPGVCAVGFTSSGNQWNCKIGVWLAVRNNATAAKTWAVDLLRNKIDSRWETCMTCTTTMPTFVCTVQVPSTQNFHFNNAYSMLNQWSYETNASQTACMRYATLVIGQVNCVRKPTHQKFLVTTTITGSENPLNMWIEYMGGYGDKDFLQACYSGGNCNVIIPMRIGSDSENIYVDFAVCCSASRTICSDIYSSGNMQLGSKGNALRAYPYTLCYASQSEVYTCVMCQWPTTIIFNVDDPASQFATRVIAANTISAYCMATTSDVRQKKDIVPYNNGLCDIKNLDIISFRYKSEDDKAIKHVSVPANWTCQLISGKNQDQFRVNDTVGILLSAVKDLSKSMTLMQKIKLWFYKKFIEPRNNKKLNDKLESFN